MYPSRKMQQRRAQAKRDYYRHQRKAINRSLERKAKNYALIKALKTQPCTDCQQQFHHAVMQFDHVQPGKYKPVSSMYTYNTERLLAEVAKCELVCANCHALRTWKRLQEKDDGGM